MKKRGWEVFSGERTGTGCPTGSLRPVQDEVQAPSLYETVPARSTDGMLARARSSALRPRTIARVDVHTKWFGRFELFIYVEGWRYDVMFKNFINRAVFLKCDEVFFRVRVTGIARSGHEAVIMVRGSGIRGYFGMRKVADLFLRSIDYRPSKLLLVDEQRRSVAQIIG